MSVTISPLTDRHRSFGRHCFRDDDDEAAGRFLGGAAFAVDRLTAAAATRQVNVTPNLNG